jgi:hypothetical protein
MAPYTKDAPLQGFRNNLMKGKKLEPGRFAEGPSSPGFVLPASAVSEQEDRHFKLVEKKRLRRCG